MRQPGRLIMIGAAYVAVPLVLLARGEPEGEQSTSAPDLTTTATAATNSPSATICVRL